MLSTYAMTEEQEGKHHLHEDTPSRETRNKYWNADDILKRYTGKQAFGIFLGRCSTTASQSWTHHWRVITLTSLEQA